MTGQIDTWTYLERRLWGVRYRLRRRSSSR